MSPRTAGRSSGRSSAIFICRCSARTASVSATAPSTSRRSTLSRGGTCSLISTRDSDMRSSTSRAMRCASACITPRNRSRAAASSLAGPRSVSMKPISAASGDRNSWLALATKSARLCSARLALVSSRSTSTTRGARGSSEADRSAACSMKVRASGTGTLTSCETENTPESTVSTAASTSGCRSESARSRPSSSIPRTSRAGALTAMISRAPFSRITGSGSCSRKACGTPVRDAAGGRETARSADGVSRMHQAQPPSSSAAIATAAPTSTRPAAVKPASRSTPGANATTAARRPFSLFRAIPPPAKPTDDPAPDGDDDTRSGLRPECAREVDLLARLPGGCVFAGRRAGRRRRTRGSGLHRHALAQILCRDHAIPPCLFGDIESLISALDELGQWFDRNEFGNADRHRHPSQIFAGFTDYESQFTDSLANVFGQLARVATRRPRQYDGKLLATVADCGILPFDVLTESNRYHPENLITDLMPELVVELLEVIDVDQQQGQGFALFRGAARRFTQHAVEHLAIAETGQSVHQRFATRSVEFRLQLRDFRRGRSKLLFQLQALQSHRPRPRQQPAHDLPNAGFALPDGDLVRRTFQELLILGRISTGLLDHHRKRKRLVWRSEKAGVESGITLFRESFAVGDEGFESLTEAEPFSGGVAIQHGEIDRAGRYLVRGHERECLPSILGRLLKAVVMIIHWLAPTAGRHAGSDYIKRVKAG